MSGVDSEKDQWLASFVLCPAFLSSSEILTVHAPGCRLNWKLEPFEVLLISWHPWVVVCLVLSLFCCCWRTWVRGSFLGASVRYTVFFHILFCTLDSVGWKACPLCFLLCLPLFFLPLLLKTISSCHSCGCPGDPRLNIALYSTMAFPCRYSAHMPPNTLSF